MLARYEEDFEADSDATEEGEGAQGAQGAQGAAGGGATGGEDGVMEATLRDRGGAGQSCYGGFAACQVTRSTSELSDRSPGAAPVAAPEVAALEKTLKQLQLEVAARNQACNPVCRSPPPRVSSLQPCNPVWPGGGRGDTARGRRCAQRRACSSKLACWWRHSSAARPPRTDPPGAELLYALQKSARAAPIAMKRLWCHPCVPKLEPSRCFYPPRHAPRGGGGTLADRRPRKSVGCLLLPGRPCVIMVSSHNGRD